MFKDLAAITVMALAFLLITGVVKSEETKSVTPKEFVEKVVDLFVKTLGLYPVGSLFEINTGEQAVVF